MAHSHDQAGHSHGEENLSDRQLILAVAINVLLTLAQIVGGSFQGHWRLSRMHCTTSAMRPLLVLHGLRGA